MKITLDNLFEGKYYKVKYQQKHLDALYIKVEDGIIYSRYLFEDKWYRGLYIKESLLKYADIIIEVPESEVFLEFL